MWCSPLDQSLLTILLLSGEEAEAPVCGLAEDEGGHGQREEGGQQHVERGGGVVRRIGGTGQEHGESHQASITVLLPSHAWGDIGQ